METFDLIFKYLLKVEGEYSNDKYDKGGKTKYGIIEVEARKYGFAGDMRELSLDFARNIYNKKYYHGNRLNEIRDKRVSLSICDWVVNSGKWGLKKAQSTLNALGYNLAVDGIFGNKTIQALNEVDSDKFLEMYHNSQRNFYRNIVKYNPTQKKFLQGWLNRVYRKEIFIEDNLVEV